MLQSLLSAGGSTVCVCVCVCLTCSNLTAELNLILILFCAAPVPAANLKAILSSVDEITEQNKSRGGSFSLRKSQERELF